MIEKDATLDEEDALHQLPDKMVENDMDFIETDEVEKISTIAEKRMRVISLQSLASTGACSKIVSNFVNSKSRRIISSTEKFLVYCICSL